MKKLTHEQIDILNDKLNRLFDLFNAELFNSEIETAPFGFGRNVYYQDFSSNGVSGEFRFLGEDITIYRSAITSRQVDTILIHEMVHRFIFQKYGFGDSAHNQKFLYGHSEEFMRKLREVANLYLDMQDRVCKEFKLNVKGCSSISFLTIVENPEYEKLLNGRDSKKTIDNGGLLPLSM